MSIVAPVAGAYIGTYNASPLNYTRSGYNLNFTQKAERIEETDIFGLNLIEMIYRGANLTIDTICKVYNTVTRGAFWPWNPTVMGRVYAAATPIGQQGSLINNILVLTAVLGTSAAVADGTARSTFTASVIISPDNNSQIVLNSVVKEVPLRFDVLMRETAGLSPTTGSLFTIT